MASENSKLYKYRKRRKIKVRYVSARNPVYFQIDNERVRRQVSDTFPHTEMVMVDPKRGIVAPGVIAPLDYEQDISEYILQMDPRTFHDAPAPNGHRMQDAYPTDFDQEFGVVPRVEPQTNGGYQPGFRLLAGE